MMKICIGIVSIMCVLICFCTFAQAGTYHTHTPDDIQYNREYAESILENDEPNSFNEQIGGDTIPCAIYTNTVQKKSTFALELSGSYISEIENMSAAYGPGIHGEFKYEYFSCVFGVSTYTTYTDVKLSSFVDPERVKNDITTFDLGFRCYPWRQNLYLGLMYSLVQTKSEVLTRNLEDYLASHGGTDIETSITNVLSGRGVISIGFQLLKNEQHELVFDISKAYLSANTEYSTKWSLGSQHYKRTQVSAWPDLSPGMVTLIYKFVF